MLGADHPVLLGEIAMRIARVIGQQEATFGSVTQLLMQATALTSGRPPLPSVRPGHRP